MSVFTRWKNRLIAGLATRSPKLAQHLVSSYSPTELTGEIPWTPPGKLLRNARMALVTTAGLHHPDQTPFDMDDPDGDPSFRSLNGKTLLNDFRITHDYYDHSDARKDPNIVFPLERLQELVDEGLLGDVAGTHYGFMGHIQGRHLKTLTEHSARQVADRLKADRVDLVLLTPA